MTGNKLVFSVLLAFIFLVVQVMSVGAAPLTQEETPPEETLLTVTVESVTLGEDPDTGEPTVIVNYTDDETGEPNSLVLDVETAAGLGMLVVDDTGTPVVDENGNLVVDESAYGSTIEIDSTTVSGEEEEQHPVGSALSDFFSGLLGVEYETVMEYHDSGVGFGVIAQALWMANALDGGSETFSAILEAKQNKDFSAITLPDGSTPQNWGQFRKAVMSDKDKSKNNLGAVMSGRANGEDGDDLAQPRTNNGNGANKDKDNGKGKDKNKDKGKGKGKNK